MRRFRVSGPKSKAGPAVSNSELPDKPADQDRPFRADFVVARAQLLLGKLEPSEALPIIEAYLNKGPDYYRGLGVTTRALCLVRLERHEEAEAALSDYDGTLLAAAAPDHYERRLHLSTLAEIYDGLGDHEQAAEYRDQRPDADEFTVDQ